MYTVYIRNTIMYKYLPEVDGCSSLPPGLELVPRDEDKPLSQNDIHIFL